MVYWEGRNRHLFWVFRVQSVNPSKWQTSLFGCSFLNALKFYVLFFFEVSSFDGFVAPSFRLSRFSTSSFDRCRSRLTSLYPLSNFVLVCPTSGAYWSPLQCLAVLLSFFQFFCFPVVESVLGWILKVALKYICFALRNATTNTIILQCYIQINAHVGLCLIIIYSIT
jgi:hypothetical protein